MVGSEKYLPRKTFLFGTTPRRTFRKRTINGETSMVLYLHFILLLCFSRFTCKCWLSNCLFSIAAGDVPLELSSLDMGTFSFEDGDKLK
jgi:hypothetical protein